MVPVNDGINMPVEPARSTGSRRKWFQFSLATLVTITFVTSTVMAFVSAAMRRAEKERRAIVEIISLGGDAFYREMSPFGSPVLSAIPEPLPQPTLSSILSSPSAYRVIGVSLAYETYTYKDVWFESTSTRPAVHRKGSPWSYASEFGWDIGWPTNHEGQAHLMDLKRLARFNELEFVDLGEREVVDRDFEDLACLTGLKVVVARHASRLTHQGIDSLASLSHLQVLRLNECCIGVNTLQALARLQGLKMLDLRRCKFEPGGLRFVRDLKGLDALTLEDASIVDSDLADVSRCTSLVALSLRNTNIGTSGTEYLQYMQKLGELNLAGTKVTDESVPHLIELTDLVLLNLADTQITYEGANAIDEGRPRATIIR